MRSSGWEVRQIYELPEDDILNVETFFQTFGKYRDVNGHKLETIRTRPKYAVMSSLTGHEGLNLADTVLIMRTRDIQGITAGESLRLDGELFRIITVSYPLRGLVRLDLQGVGS